MIDTFKYNQIDDNRGYVNIIDIDYPVYTIIIIKCYHHLN